MTCMLCGSTSGSVAMALLLYSNGKYDQGPRCRDQRACYLRVISQGETWDLVKVPKARPGEDVPW